MGRWSGVRRWAVGSLRWRRDQVGSGAVGRRCLRRSRLALGRVGRAVQRGGRGRCMSRRLGLGRLALGRLALGGLGFGAVGFGAAGVGGRAGPGGRAAPGRGAPRTGWAPPGPPWLVVGLGVGLVVEAVPAEWWVPPAATVRTPPGWTAPAGSARRCGRVAPAGSPRSRPAASPARAPPAPRSPPPSAMLRPDPANSVTDGPRPALLRPKYRPAAALDPPAPLAIQRASHPIVLEGHLGRRGDRYRPAAGPAYLDADLAPVPDRYGDRDVQYPVGRVGSGYQRQPVQGRVPVSVADRAGRDRLVRGSQDGIVHLDARRPGRRATNQRTLQGHRSGVVSQQVQPYRPAVQNRLGHLGGVGPGGGRRPG